MFIKNIKMSGFKNVPDTEIRQYDFYNFTKIKGENFVGKTSLGDALCWVFSGKSSTGVTADYVLRNDKSHTAIVEVEFDDNNGKAHTLRREMKGYNSIVYFDDIPVREAELYSYIGNPDIFLSTFMIGYFHRLSPKTAKELLMGIIPFPSHKTILVKVEENLHDYLPNEEESFDSNGFLKQKRSELKMVEDEVKRLNEKQKITEDKIKGIKLGELADEGTYKVKLEAIENRKVELIKLSAQNVSIGFLEGRVLAISMEIKKLRSEKENRQNQQAEICPTCKQPVPEEQLSKLREKAKEYEINVQKQIERLECEEKDLLSKIEAERDKDNKAKDIQEELSIVEQKIKMLRIDYEKVLLHNQAIKADKEFIENSKKVLYETKEQLEKLQAEKYKINRSITAVSQYNMIKADLQYESIKKSLNRVSIKLQKLNYSTNELRDCFEILYNNREYSMISTSESIRAGLEISNFINKRTGLKLPVFIDNAESITHYDMPDTQTFEAKVLKDAILTVTNGLD